MTEVVKLLTPTQTEKFKSLIEKCNSRDQMTRISGRLWLNKFVMQHGEDVCKATFESFKRKPKKLSRKKRR